MKEVNAVIENTIKLISSEVIENIMINSGYFDDVEDISDQLSMENAMVFSVFLTFETVQDYKMGGYFDHISKISEKDKNVLSRKTQLYVDTAIENIVKMIKDNLNIYNITTSYSTHSSEDGMSAFVCFCFTEAYLNETRSN